jgi:hypothetical protein
MGFASSWENLRKFMGKIETWEIDGEIREENWEIETGRSNLGKFRMCKKVRLGRNSECVRKLDWGEIQSVEEC